MTREEAYKRTKGYLYDALSREEADEIIKALEQEPCEDCISRDKAKKALEDRFMELQKIHSNDRYETNFCLNTILELPSVTPQPKIGHWIRTSLTQISGGDFKRGCKCSCCDYATVVDDFNYCPNCGSKMEEVEE